MSVPLGGLKFLSGEAKGCVWYLGTKSDGIVKDVKISSVPVLALHDIS